ncbi:UNVERIFIED_CONTAM: hypothetical protein Sradi_3572000, partial [Sesamum radiatum]
MADEHAVGGAQAAIRLHASDHPMIALVSVPLNGINYLSWSKSVKIALGAKMKLSVFNGRSERPHEDFKDFEQWQRADWRSFFDGLLYTKLKCLWDEPACVTPSRECTCGAGKKIADLTTS